MDVASLIVVLGCIGQAVGDRYGSYGTPPAAPPASSPYSATPGYPPAPADPIFTAAAPKKTPTSPSKTVDDKAQTSAVASPSSVSAPVPTKSPPTSTKFDAAPTEKTSAGELIREAVVVPQSLSVVGRGTSLYETLGRLGDRRAQLDAVRSYWKTAATLAEFHYAWQQTQFLEHLQKVAKGRSGESPATFAEIAARLASARAYARESELRLDDAQVHLAATAMLPSGATRPLPIDLPHVGTYHTQFERLFAGRPAPTYAHSLNRTLPLRKEVVDARAEGVWAAQDAYEAAFEAYQKSQLPMEDVLAALEDFRLRRSEFLVAVRSYNEEIAEYALLCAPGGIALDSLVGMLIKNPTRPAVSDTTLDFDDGLVPASFTEPTPAFAPTPDPVSAEATPATPTVPTAAIAPPSPSIPRNELPTIPASSPPSYSMPTPPPAAFVPPTDATPLYGTPTLAPPPVAPSPAGGTSNPLRGQPTLAPPQVPTTGDGTTPRIRVNKIPLGDSEYESRNSEFDSSVVPVGYYAQLASLPPAERAQDLVEALYATPAKSDATSQRVTLAECLARVGSFEQQRVVTAYWNAAEQAARRAAWEKNLERLAALGQATLRLTDSPAKTAAMLRVRSNRLAAEAERLAAEAALTADRAALTEAVHASLAEPWLLPATSPHGGGYKTKVEALSASPAGSTEIRDAARRIDVLHAAIVLRAEAIVAGDEAADALIDEFARGRASVHTVLASCVRQADETDALLRATTRYNQTIADYALAVLPGGAPRDTLVGALVVDRSTIASRDR